VNVLHLWLSAVLFAILAIIVPFFTLMRLKQETRPVALLSSLCMTVGFASLRPFAQANQRSVVMNCLEVSFICLWTAALIYFFVVARKRRE